MSDIEVQNPTYMEHIRFFFDEVDHAHMAAKGIDLSTYQGLRQRGSDVFFQTQPPNAPMPPRDDRKWSEARSRTYRNWIVQNYPFGTPSPVALEPDVADRIRKDVDDLDAAEIATLKKAFEGVMALSPDDPESYFAIAGVHWWPTPTYCQHHVDKYHSWHRAYLLMFEDALREIPGCEAVTLPYWDIAKPPPDFLFDAPFNSYTLPRDVHARYPQGTVTQRLSKTDIVDEVRDRDIPGTITNAMAQPTWAAFISYTQDGIEGAHDDGHMAIGPAMRSPDIAAYDPIFWFFHANWDRLWWQWQKKMQATTLWTFRSTIRGDTSWLEAPFDDIRPFQLTTRQTINSLDLGVGYQLQDAPAISSLLLAREGFGSVLAARVMDVPETMLASVRLKGIDRTQIPGSFEAHLKSDDALLARRSFFQSVEPKNCDTCRKNALVNLDFRVPLDRVLGRKLSVEIHTLVTEPGLDTRFPLSSCGNPSLNLRMLLAES